MEGKTAQNCPELIEAGVDYLTLTCNRDRAGRKLAAVADMVLLQEKGKGNFIKDWRWEGYRGFHCGGIQTGVRHDGLIVRMSSYVAHQHAARVLPLATNVSRIDLQATIRLPADSKDLSVKHYREAVAHKRKQHTRLEIEHRHVDGGGSTLYLGKRVSDYFFRCYDKYHETGLDHYNNCWRNELELKGDAAKHMWTTLRDDMDHRSLAQSVVGSYMMKRGLRPLWSHNSVHTFVSAQRSTNAADRLRWLAGQVSNSVKQLIDAGYGPETLEALGLTEAVLSSIVGRKTGPRRLKGEKEHGGAVASNTRTSLLVANF